MFELTSIAAKDTYTINLVNANDEPLLQDDGSPVSITVYGPGSKHHQRAQARRTQLALDRMAKRGGKIKITAEEQQKEQAEFLAACTHSFNGLSYNGSSTGDAILAAYSDPSIGFIADQVSKALGDWANFSNSSAKS